jgi:hypothetical protein
MNVQHTHITASIPHDPTFHTLALSVQALLALSAVLEDLILAEKAHGVAPDVIEEMDSVKKARAVFVSARDAYTPLTPPCIN